MEVPANRPSEEELRCGGEYHQSSIGSNSVILTTKNQLGPTDTMNLDDTEQSTGDVVGSEPAEHPTNRLLPHGQSSGSIVQMQDHPYGCKIRKNKLVELGLMEGTTLTGQHDCELVSAADKHLEKTNCKANGCCWIGNAAAVVNGENGFTKLDHHHHHHHQHHASWMDQKLENHQSDVRDHGCCTDPADAGTNPSPRDARGSLDETKDDDEPLSRRICELNLSGSVALDEHCRCPHLCRRGMTDGGDVQMVVAEQASPVVLVDCSPLVHVANAVISGGGGRGVAARTTASATCPADGEPSSGSEADRTNFCGLISADDAETAGQGDIGYVAYASEQQMPDIMRLIQKDLSEPYSIYTYRYFIHNWPKLCFLAMDDEKCVGAIVCKLDLHKKVVRRGYIAMLAVDENYRKRKIGSNLVLKAIQAMVEDDADEVVLETEISNKPALRLYENLGFVRDKRLFRYYLNGVDALRLKLWLR